MSHRMQPVAAAADTPSDPAPTVGKPDGFWDDGTEVSAPKPDRECSTNSYC